MIAACPFAFVSLKGQIAAQVLLSVSVACERLISVTKTLRTADFAGLLQNSELIKWPFLRKVKFFCKTMFPHSGGERPEKQKMCCSDFSAKLNPLQNHGNIHLQDHEYRLTF